MAASNWQEDVLECLGRPVIVSALNTINHTSSKLNFCSSGLTGGGKGGGNKRRTAAGELVLSAASTGMTFDANLLLMSLPKMQQAQAEQLARSDRFEKMLSQAVSLNKRRGHGASQESPESTTTASASVTQQVIEVILLVQES